MQRRRFRMRTADMGAKERPSDEDEVRLRHDAEAVRHLLNMTKTDFAASLGIGQGSYSNFIAGRRRCPAGGRSTLQMTIAEHRDRLAGGAGLGQPRTGPRGPSTQVQRAVRRLVREAGSDETMVLEALALATHLLTLLRRR